MAPQREWFEKDYYKTLGLTSSASAKEITQTYRKLAREFHPDANPDNPSAEDRFKEISAAYEVVGDEKLRKEYDEVRAMGPANGRMGPGGFGGPGGGFGGPGGSSGNIRVEDLGDLGDLFGGLFGGRGGGRNAGPQRSGAVRGDDLETTLTLSFFDAVKGLSTTLHLQGEGQCETCKGSGAKPGTKPTVCGVCQGRGVVDDNQGYFSLSQPCTACMGRGQIVTDPCPTCSGRGTAIRNREVKVRIPAGVADGQHIKLTGRGGPGRAGGPPGDLLVLVRVTPDDRFGRDGRNLTLTVPITYAEATLGGAITVPTLDGEPVKLKIAAGTPNGRTLRVKGRGVTSGGKTGDLLVTVEIHVPTDLTPEQRAAVDALAASFTESPRTHLGV